MLNKISEVSKKVEKGLKHGHPCCNDDAVILLMLNTAKLSCFSKKERRKYDDLIRGITFDCVSKINKVTVTDNNKNLWETNNPECISRKQWERIAYKMCYRYNIDIFLERIQSPTCEVDFSIEGKSTECITDILTELIPKSCDVYIDTTRKDTICDLAFDISKNILDCDVLTVISLQQKMCDLNIKIEPSKEQCEAEHKILIEAYPTCTLTKKQYTTLISKNYNYCGLSMIYDKGLEITVDETGECIQTSLNSYTVGEDLKFKGVVAKDKKTVKEILNDYKISNIIKTKITNEIYLI